LSGFLEFGMGGRRLIFQLEVSEDMWLWEVEIKVPKMVVGTPWCFVEFPQGRNGGAEVLGEKTRGGRLSNVGKGRFDIWSTSSVSSDECSKYEW
jgi:hypothetical protein